MTNPEIEAWEARFDGEHYLFGTEPNVFLTREAHRIPAGGRVLAVADGEGRNGVWLAQQGHAVHSIEGSARAVAKAVRLAQERGVTVVDSLDDLVPGALFAEVGDVLANGWPAGQYDAVVAIFIQFLKPTERPAVFAAMAGALRAGGVLLLEGYHHRQLAYRTGGPPVLDQLYDESFLRTAFPTLQVDDIVEYDVEISEGTQHSGMSAVIDLVASMR